MQDIRVKKKCIKYKQYAVVLQAHMCLENTLGFMGLFYGSRPRGSLRP